MHEIDQGWIDQFQTDVNFLFIKEPKSIMASTNILSSIAIYKMFLKQQISILEWFLKEEVILKAKVMMPENSSLPSQE